ncbi:uncharacterized protein LOC135926773 [Gordionus sp. m RMFG-2023]|uniref:uncharacterized protein LOC135926773 n=1 Tax=Gordionus sp. m RMFG-2023 TaxID=3053472 RepID=UPI0031FD20F1
MNKLAVLLRMLTAEKIDILGIQETHYPGDIMANFNEYKMFCSGTTSNSWSGIAFLINKRMQKYVMKFVPISERCGLLYLHTNFKPTIIVNFYVPPKRSERLAFVDIMINIIHSLPERYNIIILGDLNMDIGREAEYMYRNVTGHATLVQSNSEYSKKLLDFCCNKDFKIENTFFSHRDRNTYTFERAQQQSQIDFFISNIHRWFVDVKALTNMNLSDHRLLRAIIIVKNLWGYHNGNRQISISSSATPPCNEITRKLSKIRTLDDERHFDEILSGKEASYNTIRLASVEKSWNLFKDALVDTYRVLPDVSLIHRKEWMANDTLEKINQLRTACSSNKDLWKMIQRLLRRDRRVYSAKKAFDIDKDVRENRLHDAYKKLKYFCKPNGFQKVPSIVLNDGKIIIDQDEQMALWLDYYITVFDGRKVTRATNVNIIMAPPQSGFTLVEIMNVIKKLRNNKAPGLDNITAEHLKIAPRTTSSFLLALFNKIWENGSTPTEWNKSLICNFPKTANPLKFTDYRACALTSCVAKIFMVLMKNKIVHSTPNLFSKYICAYRPNKNILEPILSLKIIMQKCYRYKIPSFYTFIDFSRAFDNVNHEALWETLVECGIETQIIRILKYHYSNLFACFKINNKTSPFFRIKKGVKQGCTLSPLLFNIIINKIIKEVLGAADLVDIGSNEKIFFVNRIISYADDIVVISKSIEETKNLLYLIETVSYRAGLRINFNKTVILPSPNAPSIQDFTVGTNTVKIVENIKYLGVILDNKGSCKDEMKMRIQKARGAFYRYMKIWKASEISVFTRLRIFNSLIVPIALYGGDIWEAKKTEIRRLQSFINNCLRTIHGIFYPRVISNSNLWRKSTHTPVNITLRKRRIQLLGHVIRNSDNSLVHDAITWLYSYKGKQYTKYKSLWYYKTIKDIMDLNVNMKQFIRLNNNKRSIKKLFRIKKSYLQ